MSKKVLIITSTFPTSEKDNQIPWMGEFLKKLKARGLKIEVLAPAYRGLASHFYFGIPVLRFRYAPKPWEILTHEEGAVFKLRQKPWLYFLPVFYLFFGTIALFKKIRQSNYDIIHINWPFPQGLFGIVAKIFTKAKLILTFYGAEFALAKKIPLGKLILQIIIKNADEVIAISGFTKRKIQAIARVPVTIIPFVSGISKADLLRRQSPKVTHKIKRILFVGRLIERKGIVYLIKAMPQVISKIPARLDIVGGGSLFSELARKIKALNLENQIFLQGKVCEKKLVNFYNQCDAFVLPAIVDRWGDTEGLGVVLLEAMSFKKPVVASKVGGITGIIKNNQTGILVPQKNSQALAKAIVKILTDKNLSEKLAQSGYQFLQENFTWEKIIAQTIEVYN